eukprot:1148690-Pelagomonas_calceolata.AAC.1
MWRIALCGGCPCSSDFHLAAYGAIEGSTHAERATQVDLKLACWDGPLVVDEGGVVHEQAAQDALSAASCIQDRDGCAVVEISKEELVTSKQAVWWRVGAFVGPADVQDLFGVEEGGVQGTEDTAQGGRVQGFVGWVQGQNEGPVDSRVGVGNAAECEGGSVRRGRKVDLLDRAQQFGGICCGHLQVEEWCAAHVVGGVVGGVVQERGDRAGKGQPHACLMAERLNDDGHDPWQVVVWQTLAVELREECSC